MKRYFINLNKLATTLLVLAFVVAPVVSFAGDADDSGWVDAGWTDYGSDFGGADLYDTSYDDSGWVDAGWSDYSTYDDSGWTDAGWSDYSTYDDSGWVDAGWSDYTTTDDSDWVDAGWSDYSTYDDSGWVDAGWNDYAVNDSSRSGTLGYDDSGWVDAGWSDYTTTDDSDWVDAGWSDYSTYDDSGWVDAGWSDYSVNDSPRSGTLSVDDSGWVDAGWTDYGNTATPDDSGWVNAGWVDYSRPSAPARQVAAPVRYTQPRYVAPVRVVSTPPVRTVSAPSQPIVINNRNVNTATASPRQTQTQKAAPVTVKVTQATPQPVVVATPQPRPVPVPVPVPTPVPTPRPVPVPTPYPVPQPRPYPYPQPRPLPIPVPQPIPAPVANVPQCQIYVPANVRPNSTVQINWVVSSNTQNATLSGTFVGTHNVSITGGRGYERVRIGSTAQSYVYTLTVRGVGGSSTCYATINAQTVAPAPGYYYGGSTAQTIYVPTPIYPANPMVTESTVVTPATLQLAQVPYTGANDAAYILTLIALALATGFGVYVYKGQLLTALAGISGLAFKNEGVDDAVILHEEVVTEGVEDESPTSPEASKGETVDSLKLVNENGEPRLSFTRK